MNNTRSQLAVGIAPEQMDAFRRTIEGSLTRVEQICRKYRIKPEHLPSPSYRAYQYLRSIDLKNLPVKSRSSSEPAETRLRVSNLTRACDNLHEMMSDLLKGQKYETSSLTADSPELVNIQKNIRRQVKRVDRRCAELNASPADLPPRSRRAYQWLRLLSDSGSLLLHLDTLAMAYRIAALPENRRGFPILYRRQQIRISIYNSTSLYRARQHPDHYEIMLHEGFISAPPEIIEALMHSVLRGRTKTRSAAIRRYHNSEEFLEISMAMALSDGGSSLSARGRQYDLEEVFKRVNSDYFGGKMEQPQLCWNRTLTRRKFGHYQPDSDTVMLSLTLDSPKVPQMVVDFVMYHELLHKALGIKLVGSRQYAHTSEFRAAEKNFRHYHEAQAALNRLARGKAI